MILRQHRPTNIQKKISVAQFRWEHFHTIPGASASSPARAVLHVKIRSRRREEVLTEKLKSEFEMSLVTSSPAKYDGR
jgi:hypothetical protein